MDISIPPPASRQEFEIAILCALNTEFDAVDGVFDQHWEDERRYGKAPGDPNAYSTGRIGEHDVVLAFLAGMGNISSANAASSLRSSFTGIKLALVVGICGGSPYDLNGQDILLGDVVISKAIVQSDMGQQFSEGLVVTNLLEDSLGRPNSEIRAFLNKLSSLRATTQIGEGTRQYLSELLSKSDYKAYQHPGADNDILYPASYRHKHRSDPCAICARCQHDHDPVCDEARSSTCAQLRCEEHMMAKSERLQEFQDRSERRGVRISRTPRVAHPSVHQGRIASANHTQQSAPLRDRLVQERKAIAFEMEGAGAWDNFPTVVIKGVCDYADSHKNNLWQPYAAATAAACMKAFLKAWIRVDRPRGPDPKPKIEEFKVPLQLKGLPVTGHFISRNTVIEDIERSILPTISDRRKVHVLHGLGGIGKTQLAIEYSRKHQNTYDSIIWVNGGSRDTVVQSLATFASSAGIAGDPTSTAGTAQQAQDTKAKADAVLKWLAHDKNCRWLMVFDNVDRDIEFDQNDDQAYDVTSFLPATDQGSVLITTRLPSLSDMGQSTKISQLDLDQSLELLSHCSGRDMKNVSLDPGTSSNSLTDMKKLVERLGCLPLALVQAGTYMRQTATSYRRYVELYESSWSELTAETPRLRDYANGSIQTTWMISYHRVRQSNETAGKLLQLWAHLDRQDIWYELFERGRAGVPECEWVQELAQSEIGFKIVMKNLVAYSLIESHLDTDSYSVHPVVHDWCAEAINDDTGYFIATALNTVGVAIPEQLANLELRLGRRLLPHAERCARQLQSFSPLNQYEDESALRKIGGLLSYWEKNAVAETPWQRALAQSERKSGPTHPDTLRIIGSLGALYLKLHKYVEAEKYLWRALAGQEKALSPNHPDTSDTVVLLGELYSRQDKCIEAEQLIRRALAGLEKVLGFNHHRTLYTAACLGELYSRQDKYTESEQLLRRALAGYEKTLSPDDPDTFFTAVSLGELYYKQGNYGEAEKMLQRALAECEKEFGPDHEEILQINNDLQNLYAEIKARESRRDSPSTPDKEDEELKTNGHPQVSPSVVKMVFSRLKAGIWERKEDPTGRRPSIS
ncbi:MAG: hypothetical protein Q9219_004699 [cf. Caloplaca sp. 3 TL-2023]